jgi:hypothetical protein
MVWRFLGLNQAPFTSFIWALYRTVLSVSFDGNVQIVITDLYIDHIYGAMQKLIFKSQFAVRFRFIRVVAFKSS